MLHSLSNLLNLQVCCPEDIFVPKKTITGEDFVVRDAIGNLKDNEGSIWEFPTEPPKTSIRQSSNEYYDYYDEDEDLYDEAFDKELDESQYFENEEYYRHKCPVESTCSQIEQCSEEGDIISCTLYSLCDTKNYMNYYLPEMCAF